MDPRHQSARISRKGVAEVDKVKELEVANRSDSVENSDQVAVDEVVPETDDEAMEDAVVIQAVVVETDPGNDPGPVEGAKEEQVHASQNNSLNDQGKTVCYKLRAALPRRFTVAAMEEVYQDLCTVKHAANLARQEILEFVADNALGWLRLAFKKIHSNDLSREACHVDKARVMKMVEALKIDQRNFPQTPESMAKPNTEVTVIKKVERRSATLGGQRAPSEDRDGHSICRSKCLSQDETIGQPPVKKSKKDDDDDSDDDVNGESESEEPADNSDDDEEERDMTSWKEFYKRSSTADNRTGYLSEFYKYLQTLDGGLLSEDEALASTRQVHKMMEAMDSDTNTIACLLNCKAVWEWVEPRIETELSGRTLQKYLLSLEKFYIFVSHWHLPLHLPRFSKKTKDLAERLKLFCPNWRRSAGKMAFEKRWKRLLDDPEYTAEDDVRRRRLIRRILKPDLSHTMTSSDEGNEPTARWPRRKKWEKKDTELLRTHFKRNPGMKAIRRKMAEVEELEELMKREGLARCYEKVKSMYKKK